MSYKSDVAEFIGGRSAWSILFARGWPWLLVATCVGALTLVAIVFWRN